MKKYICLQAAHEDIVNNCDSKLRSGTGAPGEAEFSVRVRNRLSQILLSKKNQDGSEAFMLRLVNANANCVASIEEDFDLFLAIHYDANIYGKGGGFADFPEPSTDQATAESQRIAKTFNETYFPESGIEYINRSNSNTRYYYMWQYLSAKTPCVIIECGVGKDAHDNVILNDTERVANALAKSICKAFNIPWEILPPQPPPTDWKKKYEDEVNAHTVTKEEFKRFKEDAKLDKENAVKAETQRVKQEILTLADRL